MTTLDRDVSSLNDADFEALFEAELARDPSDDDDELGDADAPTSEDPEVQESTDTEQEEAEDDASGDDGRATEDPDGEEGEGAEEEASGKLQESTEEGEGEDTEEGAGTDSDGSDNEDPLKKLYEPFKANGVEIAVKSVDEARTLMQMGANYQKKMMAIKPHLRRVKTLEANDITDDDLNLLVELKKGDPGAIKKLLADHNVDPLDVDISDGKEYKPKDYTVSETQYNLTTVLEELRESPNYDETLRVVGVQWDEDSRNEIRANPELIRGIHDQISNGDYKVIQSEVERERALGRLQGVNDLEAYVRTFNKLRNESQGANSNGVTEANPKSNGNKQVDPKAAQRNKAKQSAAISSGNRGGKSVADVPDINRMSDEDFEKFFAKHNPVSY